MDKSDMEARHDQLISQVRERIEFDYAKVKAQGVIQPVIFVMHLSSPQAQAICGEVCSAQKIHTHCAEATLRGVDPMVTWPMSETAASGLLRGEDPAIAERVLGPWPPDVIVIICVSELGITLECLPVC